jgi:signal transduction histidine kinase
MSHLARLLVLSVVFLLLFVVTALLAQTWLQRQHIRLQNEAIATKRAQFLAAYRFTGTNTEQWSASHLESIGQIIDAHIRISRPAPVASKPGRVVFTEEAISKDGIRFGYVAIEFDLPEIAQLSVIHGRTWGVLLFIAISLLVVFIAAGLWFTRRLGGRDSHTPWSTVKSDMSSWLQLAKTSVAQGTALAQERDNRERIEKDLTLNKILQNQALEEKIRLGRDLHDGVIQSLYAVGMTIEAVRPLIGKNPEKADLSLKSCLDALNQAIRDVRQYITGLSPEKLRQLGFSDAVQSFVNELSPNSPIDLELVVDEDAAAALSPTQNTEILQIAHEAISNALRHGQADAITIRLHCSDSEIGLLIRDNGHGFDPENRDLDGHGITNMWARANGIGATLRIDSQSGSGTRIVVTIPATEKQ